MIEGKNVMPDYPREACYAYEELGKDERKKKFTSLVKSLTNAKIEFKIIKKGGERTDSICDDISSILITYKNKKEDAKISLVYRNYE